MAKLLQISQLGNSVLRERAEEVKNISSKSVQALIDDMIATVIDAEGVGIAAPQVYEPYRIFIIASHPNSRSQEAPLLKPFAVINPKIVADSKEVVKEWEGCLSIPGIRGFVPCYEAVSVEYQTGQGKVKAQRLEGFMARIFQHELDHLDGLVFLDRLDTPRDVITEKEYQKLIAKEE